MQGQHQYQPELFSQIDYEALIPPSHLLRKIDKVLDLSFLRELTASFYSNEQGRPSIDPEIFVRMILLEFLYNIDSDRQLCEEVGYNLAYRWFCKLSLTDRVPDHSSITRIRDRLGEETYRKIFLKVVDQCKAAGLVKGESMMTDGSVFRVNASIYKMKERESKNTDDKDPRPPTSKPGIGVAPSKDGLSNNDLRRNSIVGVKLKNETHVSTTDPDASLAGKSGEYKSLSYKTHHMIESESRVIVDCHVTTGTVAEVKTIVDRVDIVRRDIGLEITELIADRGYGSVENLVKLSDKNIATNIPLWSSRTGISYFDDLDSGFKVGDVMKDEVYCPQGHRMTYDGSKSNNYKYKLKREICAACPFFESCLTPTDKNRNQGRRFFIPMSKKLIEVREQSQKPEFIAKMRERMWKMEGIFAEAKSHHGLKRARYRGRAKVQIQVYMISIVQNLKRLVTAAIGPLKSYLLSFIRAVENQLFPMNFCIKLNK